MFKKEDLLRYQGMKKIIAEGEFSIKGEAVIATASFFLWFNELEKKIASNQTENKEFKPIGPPVPIADTNKKSNKKCK